MVLEFNPLGCSNACVKGWVRVIILPVGFEFFCQQGHKK